MLFDVYSQHNTVCGELVAHLGNTLIYADTHVKSENTDEVLRLAEGKSYLVIVGDQEVVALQFESNHGAGDGLTEESLLQVLLHKATTHNHESSEEHSLYIRALQMAVDALAASKGFAT